MNQFQRIVGETFAGGEYQSVKTDKQAHQVGDTLFAFLFCELEDLGWMDNPMGECLKRLAKAKEQIAEVEQAIKIEVYKGILKNMTSQSQAWNWMADNIHMDEPVWATLKAFIQSELKS